MTHRSAKRKVLGATLLAPGLSSILERKVIALVFLSCFKSWERVGKAFCCNDTHWCTIGSSSHGREAEKKPEGEP